MTREVWWTDDTYFLEIISSHENGITELMARKNDSGEWEYAIVFWRRKICTLIILFSNGSLLMEYGR